MKWSEYNVLFESSKHGSILYNGLTGAFVELDERALKEIEIIRAEPNDYDPTDHLLLYEKLRKGRILVLEEEQNDIIDSMILRRQQGNYDNTILRLTIIPTFSCNFGCTYCYQQHKRPVRMGDDTEEKLIDFVRSYDKVRDISISWYGGEPLLEFDRIVSLSANLEILNIPFKAGMVTNGYLLDSRVARKLNSLRIESLQVTIDGTSEIHDKRRVLVGGGKTYKRIIDNLKMLLDCWDGKLFIRVNTDMRNQQHFAHTHDELAQIFKGTETKIYAGILRDCPVNSPDHACELEAENEGNFFVDQYESHGLVDRMFFSETTYLGCQATQRNAFTIGPEGELYKCWSDIGNPEMVVGNISKKQWNLPLYTRYMVGVDPFTDPDCRTCVCISICGGGCSNRRLRKKYQGQDVSPCMGFKENFTKYLEIAYEVRKQQINRECPA
jgi:uncharacterized protein